MFQALRAAVHAEGFSANKLALIEQAAATNYFVVAQLKELLASMAFSADKLRTLELVAPRLLDGQNSFALIESFTFGSDKDNARKI